MSAVETMKRDERVEKILLKLRKKATSAMSMKALTDALLLLGYSVEKRIEWMELTRHELGRHRGKGPKPLARNGIKWRRVPRTEGDFDDRINLDHAREDATSAKVNVRLHGYGMDADSERGLPEMRALREEMAATLGELPAKAKKDKIVTTYLGELETKVTVHEPGEYRKDGSWNVRHSFEWTAWIGRPALVITDPEGENRTCFFTSDGRDYELFAWLFAETNLDARSSAELGMPTVEDEKREREHKARDWTNTGTCPCCFRNVKLNDGRIVLHGYHRPGHGYIVGSCFGVGYEPYEVSTKGTEASRDAYLATEKRLKARLADLKSDGFSGSFTTTRGWGRTKETVTVEKGEKDWDSLRNGAIVSVERDLRHVASDIDFLTKKIDAWEPGMKMPEEIARERGWLK